MRAFTPSLFSLALVLYMVPLACDQSPSSESEAKTTPSVESSAEAKAGSKAGSKAEPDGAVPRPAEPSVTPAEAKAVPASPAASAAGSTAAPAAAPAAASPTAPAAASPVKPEVPPPAKTSPDSKAGEPTTGTTNKSRKPEGSARPSRGEGRRVGAFTDCAPSETFADGRCFSTHQAACKALDCKGSCMQLKSMPAQARCT
ncbi:MAG: hypothetical protein AAGF11_30645 [Myxococcota bacterium]